MAVYIACVVKICSLNLHGPRWSTTFQTGLMSVLPALSLTLLFTFPIYQLPEICVLFRRRVVHPYRFKMCASSRVSAHLMAGTYRLNGSHISRTWNIAGPSSYCWDRSTSYVWLRCAKKFRDLDLANQQNADSDSLFITHHTIRDSATPTPTDLSCTGFESIEWDPQTAFPTNSSEKKAKARDAGRTVSYPTVRN
jgi:hypothetical protein